jgi:hypothetical protein
MVISCEMTLVLGYVYHTVPIPVTHHDVIIATHKTIDLVFRTQVYKLKRDMPMRSRS